MKIIVLTSSRADYGIYFPLLEKMEQDPDVELNLIAFGSHLIEEQGNTVDIIENDGFRIIEKIKTKSTPVSAREISEMMAITVKKFSKIWEFNEPDLIIALGDRYEMFSACLASVPFNIKIAHIHGGETTRGAFDDIFRGSLSLMSFIHFASTDKYVQRIKKLTESNRNIYNVGALSIDQIKRIELLSKSKIQEEYGINIGIPSILFTFHPETKNYRDTEIHITEILKALKDLSNEYQIIITLPNIDTHAEIVRDKIKKELEFLKNIKIFKSLGSLGYLSVMNFCKMVVGNSSSAFIEGFYLEKYCINLGKRQEGRIRSSNIIDCDIKHLEIIQCVERIEKAEPIKYDNTYGSGNAADKMLKILKTINL